MLSKNSYRLLFIWICCATIYFPAIAQEASLCSPIATTNFQLKDSLKEMKDAISSDMLSMDSVSTEPVSSDSILKHKKTEKAMLRVLPLAFYTPETGIAGEVVAYYSFRTRQSARKSNLRFFATYTQNSQFFAILPWQVYTDKEAYFINGSLDYRIYPEYYYGIGNNTTIADRQLYTYEALTLQNKTFKNIGNHTFVGLGVSYQNLRTMLPKSVTAEGRECRLIGTEGYEYLAAGPALMYDTRDHILCAESGQYLEIATQGALGTAMNMNINFMQISLDYRNYFKVNKSGVWANQLVAQYSKGDIPYRALPALGGAYRHRGYYEGRFRDKNLLLLQTEYRQHLFWRIGMVGFASVGRVFETFNMDLAKDWHTAAGVGLRFQLSKNEHTNIRLDYSVGKDSQGFYVYFAEAF